MIVVTKEPVYCEYCNDIVPNGLRMHPECEYQVTSPPITASDLAWESVRDWSSKGESNASSCRTRTPLEKRREKAARKTKKHRSVIFAQDGYKCRICGATEKLVLDHIVPVSKGGSDDPSNLQTLCWSCNSRKGAR